jgi:hypothetical protein
MEEKNRILFNKGSILIILILFMYSSNILDIVLDIGKLIIYLIIIIYIINYLNPSIAMKIKENIKDFLPKPSTNILSNTKSIYDVVKEGTTFGDYLGK